MIHDAAMKIVSANYADSLRRPGARDTVESAVLDTVREGLLSVYGDADRDVPAELAALARQLDRPGPAGCSHA
ncbi:hypothetical protein R1A27_06890 [Methylobacterium sp. NMS12]|uniref:hypothetical protein n=1 Tax=Methylobacterium sp. NMS12 TaxID=3079766 RepID=UPI003F880321